MDVKAILKRMISVQLTMLVLCCIFALPAFAEPGDPAWDQKAKDVIKDAQRKKEEREKERIKSGRANIDERLLKLEADYKKGGEEVIKKYSKTKQMHIKDGKMVRVYLVLKSEISARQYDVSKLQSYGCEVLRVASERTIVAFIPIEMITKISEIQDISDIMLPHIPQPKAYQSEGVSLIEAGTYLQSGITGSVNGAGVKVAIIDVGFAGLSSAINNGDIPSSAIKLDCTQPSCLTTAFPNETEKHGTAVAEIVHDMAPDAQLYLLKIMDINDVMLAKTYCIDMGIKIINYSLGGTNENFYNGQCYQINGVDSSVCSAQDANNNGILFVAAAGNEAQKHYYATYSDPGNLLGWHNIIPSIAANDGDTVEVDFTWDAWPTTNQDFDIYLMYYNADGFLEICDFGALPQSGSQSPTESLSCFVDATRTYYVYIVKHSADTDPRFHIFSSHIVDPAIADRSLTSPADASGAFAVGAMHWNSWLTGSIEDYSSQGPTSDGRIKPDITGPDCVSTNSYINDPNDGPYFCGTSAATPHVAGAAALLLQLNSGYTTTQLKDALKNSAIATYGPDPEDTQPNNSYGWGRLNLPLYALSVTKNGTGAGTVTSSSSGISCGADCSESYVPTTDVTLSASPDADSSFAGWSGGGCSGTGTCDLTMAADANISATFNVLPPAAAFTSSSTSGGAPFVVSFIDQSLRASSWLWNFGDGATSTEQHPTHIYREPGAFTVSLAATNSSGTNTKTNTNYISVQVCSIPVRIQRTPLTSYSTIQAAYDGAMDGDVIQSRAVTYAENVAVNRNIAFTLKGGYGCDYTAQISGENTYLQGMITTSQGTLTISDIVVTQ